MTTNRWIRQKQGVGRMTDIMHTTLARLIAAEDAGNPWVDLGDVFHKTRSALCRNDWAIESPGLDGVRYKVTGRGRKAYAAFSAPPEPRRWDGICSRCGVRPKAVTTTGHRLGYCVECARESNRRNYAQHGNRWKHDAKRLCPACGIRRVHVSPSGHVHSYCRECRNERQREAARQRNAHKLQRLRDGETIGCAICGEPVYHTARFVSNYCKAHYRAMQQKSRRNRAWRRVVQREP